MSARCPKCNHGTSDCILTNEEWDLVLSSLIVDGVQTKDEDRRLKLKAVIIKLTVE